MKIIASKNPDYTVLNNSSSGGVFTVLAEDILQCGGVVYGAAFDEDWNIIHKRVDSYEQLPMLRGSKYAYSITEDCYLKAKRDLEEGRQVLFSGTPCQVAVMHKLGGDDDNLLLVEVVCHGAPEHKYWERYLGEMCEKRGCSRKDISSINFRDKRTGWRNYSFTIKFKNGKEISELHDDNIYMRAFLNDFILREACFRCHFKYPDGSKADITLGDFWGYQNFEQQSNDDKGISLVIFRTNKGEAFGEKLLNVSKSYNLDQVSQYNPAIIKTVVKPKRYNEFKNSVETGSLLKMMRKYASRSFMLRLKLRIVRFFNSRN